MLGRSSGLPQCQRLDRLLGFSARRIYLALDGGSFRFDRCGGLWRRLDSASVCQQAEGDVKLRCCARPGLRWL